MKSSWFLVFPVLLFSVGSLALSISYGNQHQNISPPAYLVYSAIGILGMLVSSVLIFQQRAILKLEATLNKKSITPNPTGSPDAQKQRAS